MVLKKGRHNTHGQKERKGCEVSEMRVYGRQHWSNGEIQLKHRGKRNGQRAKKNKRKNKWGGSNISSTLML